MQVPTILSFPFLLLSVFFISISYQCDSEKNWLDRCDLPRLKEEATMEKRTLETSTKKDETHKSKTSGANKGLGLLWWWKKQKQSDTRPMSSMDEIIGSLKEKLKIHALARGSSSEIDDWTKDARSFVGWTDVYSDEIRNYDY